MRRIERRWTDGSFWQNGALARVHSISKAVPLLRVAVVCLSRKLGLLIVHRQLRWFKGWIRDMGYVRSSDSKSIQDELPVPRSLLWYCGKSVTQVEFHKVFCAPRWSRTLDWGGCVSILVRTVFFCLKALDKLVQTSVVYWLLLVKGSTAFCGRMAYETWMTHTRCVRGVAGFSILVRFCMFVGLIVTFCL